MKKLIGLATVLCAFAFLAAPSLAASNPNGSGQPVAQGCLEDTTTASEPGTSASAQGSAFNETTPGKAGTVYAGNGANTNTPANSAAVSQYDIACYQVTQNH
jgi:hypothetical protein